MNCFTECAERKEFWLQFVVIFYVVFGGSWYKNHLGCLDYTGGGGDIKSAWRTFRDCICKKQIFFKQKFMYRQSGFMPKFDLIIQK